MISLTQKSSRTKYLKFFQDMLTLDLLFVSFILLSPSGAVPFRHTRRDAQTCSYNSTTLTSSSASSLDFRAPSSNFSSCSGITPPQPAFSQPFADPSLFHDHDGSFYSFATTWAGKNVQVARASEQSGWEYLDCDALPGPFPDWVLTPPAGPMVRQLLSPCSDYLGVRCPSTILVIIPLVNAKALIGQRP